MRTMVLFKMFVLGTCIVASRDGPGRHISIIRNGMFTVVGDQGTGRMALVLEVHMHEIKLSVLSRKKSPID